MFNRIYIMKKQEYIRERGVESEEKGVYVWFSVDSRNS